MTTLSSLLSLMYHGMMQTCPDTELLAQMDWDTVYKASVFHNVSSLTCMAVDSAVKNGFVLSKAQQTVYASWQENKNRAIRKAMLMDMAQKELEDFLEASGIWYMPLKGSVLKRFYPKFGMREMSDCDMLFDVRDREQVQAFFAERGYQYKYSAGSVHDTFVKPPVYNFEMHTRLFSEGNSIDFEHYYGNIEERLLTEPGKQYKKCFRTEDFYVYVLAHAFKHHSHGGNGLRTLADVYVFWEHMAGEIDERYVKEQLKCLGLSEYEAKLRDLAERVFVQGQIFVEEEDAFLNYMFSSGTYGTVQNVIDNRLKTLSEGEKLTFRTFLRYIHKRLFVEEVVLKEYFPFFYKHKWARPFCPIYRILKGFVKHPKKVWCEIKKFFGRMFYLR